MQHPIEVIEAHYRFIRSRGCDLRLRLIYTLGSLQSQLQPYPVLVCARSEGCSICSNMLAELRESGVRIVDVGVLSPAIEMDGVWSTEAPAPSPADGLPQ